jgi:hypothetical protein
VTLKSLKYTLRTIRVRLLRLILDSVANLPKVKEWLSKRITLKDVNHLELDIIVKTLVQDGNHVIGLVELGNSISTPPTKRGFLFLLNR